jgi:hypothetical protein
MGVEHIYARRSKKVIGAAVEISEKVIPPVLLHKYSTRITVSEALWRERIQ